MAERVIRQIDLLVHPDYHVIPFWGLSNNPDQEELRKRWDLRVGELVEKDDALLFYFPAIGTPGEATYGMARLKTPEQFKLEYQEILRRKKYQDLLGDRFFSFEVGEHPSREVLYSMFNQREFLFDPLDTVLIAYGEFLELCVTSWQERTGEALRIPSINQHRLENLSVKDALGVDILSNIKINRTPNSPSGLFHSNKNRYNIK